MAIEALLEQAPQAGRRAEQIGRSRKIEDARGRYIHVAKLDLPRAAAARRAQDRGRLRQRRRLPGRALGAVGAGRRGGRDRRLAQRPQHQRRLRLDRHRPAAGATVVEERRRYRHRARRRRRPADRRRREGRDGRRRPADGADRHRPGTGAASSRRRRRRDGDVQSRPRALPRRATGSSWCGPRSATATCSRRCASSGYNVGGEQSGHIILSDYATTGDGLVAALQVLAALVEDGRPASELLHLFDPLPQLLKNVRFDGGAPLEAAGVKAAIADGEARLGGVGRLRHPQVGHRAADPGDGRRRGRGDGRGGGRQHLRSGEGGLMLELRPDCERCGRDLPPDSADARICTFECTFCADCVDGPLGGHLPELRRQFRAAADPAGAAARANIRPRRSARGRR